MDDAEDHAEAIREMWMQEVHMNEDGGGGGNDYAFDPSEKSSGYRRRMAGERTGMHEVDRDTNRGTGPGTRSGSSAYRRRMAEEADEENKEQIWRDQMEEQGEALEAGIKGNQDLVDKKIDLLTENLFKAWEVITELREKGEPFVRWTPDVEEDAFLCVYPGDTDGSTTVLVNNGDCYVDGVAVTTGDHLTDTTLPAESGVIYMKYVISTNIWTGPTFASNREDEEDDIRYFYLAEMEFDDGAIAGIKPLHRGDIHFFTSGSSEHEHDEDDWSFKVKVNASDSSKVDVTAGNAYIFNDSLSIAADSVSSGNTYIVLRVPYEVTTQTFGTATIESVSALAQNYTSWDYVLATMSGGEVEKYHQMGDIYDKRLPYFDTTGGVIQVDSGGDWTFSDCLSYTSP